MNRKLLIIVFFLIIIVGVLHLLGSSFYLYWSIVWFDDVMHFLGGLSMGLLFLWTWYVSGIFNKSKPSNKKIMISALIFVVIVSIGWEVFEYVFDIANPTGGNYLRDTTQDLMDDLVGGVVAGLIGRVKAFYE